MKSTLGFGLVAFSVVAAAAFSQGCGDKGGEASYGYVTTSTTGDIAEWTFGIDDFSTVWKSIDTAGLINKTYTISGACGAADPVYLFRTCTVDVMGCAEGPGANNCGTDDPVVGTVLKALQIPGVAVIVGREGAGDGEVHAGFVPGSCGTNVAGDYLFTSLHPGDSSLFGLYRIGSSTLSGPFPQNLTHADWGLNTDDNTIDASPANPIRTKVAYSDVNGATTIDNATCSDGVYTLLANGSSVAIRANLTQSGLMVVDKPAGEGGLLSFKTSQAATLSDIASKTFVGLIFPDDGNDAQVARVTMAGISGGAVALSTLTINGVGPQPVTGQAIYPASGLTGGVTGMPNLASAPEASSGQNYATNPLASTFASASAIPGLFMITPAVGDNGRVALAAMKAGGKTLLFGAVTNRRSLGPDRYVNTGSFLFFEE